MRGAAFAAGLASTLALLGVAAASLGAAYGQTSLGDALPLGASVFAVAMGLNLLGVVSVPLPSLDLDARGLAGSNAMLAAYLAGLTFALVASPCSTPVLATLLAYTASVGDVGQGGGLLFAYSLGYVAPLLIAAVATESMRQIVSVRERTTWLSPTCGALLVAGGTYGLLTRL